MHTDGARPAGGFLPRNLDFAPPEPGVRIWQSDPTTNAGSTATSWCDTTSKLHIHSICVPGFFWGFFFHPQSDCHATTAERWTVAWPRCRTVLKNSRASPRRIGAAKKYEIRVLAAGTRPGTTGGYGRSCVELGHGPFRNRRAKGQRVDTTGIGSRRGHQHTRFQISFQSLSEVEDA